MAKILIIDSEIETCDFLKNFFTEKGFKVSIATTKKEAVDKVEKVCPKIILLDIKIGLDFVKEVKKKLQDVKIIGILDSEDNSIIKNIKKNGVDDYIIKPFSLISLEKNVVAKALSLIK